MIDRRAIAAALGLVLLGEVPPLLAIAGGAACIAGVIVARSGPKQVAASVRDAPRVEPATDRGRPSPSVYPVPAMNRFLARRTWDAWAATILHQTG